MTLQSILKQYANLRMPKVVGLWREWPEMGTRDQGERSVDFLEILHQRVSRCCITQKQSIDASRRKICTCALQCKIPSPFTRDVALHLHIRNVATSSPTQSPRPLRCLPAQIENLCFPLSQIVEGSDLKLVKSQRARAARYADTTKVGVWGLARTWLFHTWGCEPERRLGRRRSVSHIVRPNQASALDGLDWSLRSCQGASGFRLGPRIPVPIVHQYGSVESSIGARQAGFSRNSVLADRTRQGSREWTATCQHMRVCQIERAPNWGK